MAVTSGPSPLAFAVSVVDDPPPSSWYNLSPRGWRFEVVALASTRDEALAAESAARLGVPDYVAEIERPCERRTRGHDIVVLSGVRRPGQRDDPRLSFDDAVAFARDDDGVAVAKLRDRLRVLVHYPARVAGVWRYLCEADVDFTPARLVCVRLAFDVLPGWPR